MEHSATAELRPEATVLYISKLDSAKIIPVAEKQLLKRADRSSRSWARPVKRCSFPEFAIYPESGPLTSFPFLLSARPFPLAAYSDK